MSLVIRRAAFALVVVASHPAVVEAQDGPPPLADGQVAISDPTGLMRKADRFTFSLDGGPPVTLTYRARRAVFPATLAVGAPFSVQQVGGPRRCTITPARDTATVGGIEVSATCEAPPWVRATARVVGLAADETVAIGDEYGLEFATSGRVTTAPIGGYPIGDEVVFTPLRGPRPCRITPARLTVPSTAFTITVDCTPGAGAGPVPPSSGDAATLAAPPGSRVVLRNAAGDTLVVTARSEPGMRMTSTPFAFRRGGRAAGVTVRRAPAGLRCLVTGDDDAGPVRVICDREWDLVTRSADDKAFASFYETTGTPVIGGTGEFEGRYVAYVTYAAGIAGTTGKKRQVVWRDRWTGTTRLASTAAGGGEGNDDSGDPAISADGQSVAFWSRATNLVPGDANGVRDVFVWNARTNAVTRVSEAPGGVAATGESSDPAISADGTVIAFASAASNLVSTPRGNGATEVYRRDMRSGEVVLLSLDEKTRRGGGGARPAITDDGARIVFHSAAALRQDDRNGVWDIYLWEQGQPLRLVSTSSTGAPRTQGNESAARVVAPAIAATGAVVTFPTTASLAPPVQAGPQNAYLVDLASGRVAAMNVDGSAAPAAGDSPVGQGERIPVSADGRWVAFSTAGKNMGGSVVLKNTATGEVVVVTEPGARVGAPGLSRAGSYVIVGSGESRDARFRSSGIFVKLR